MFLFLFIHLKNQKVISYFRFRFGFARVTSEKTVEAKEFTYLKIVDMDPSPCNIIVTETYPDKKTYQVCPHHIVKDTIKILKGQIEQRVNKEDHPTLQQAEDAQKILKRQHQEVMAAINAMKEEINEIKSKMSTHS